MFNSVRPAARGKVWTNQANSLILLFVRPAAKYEPALSVHSQVYSSTEYFNYSYVYRNESNDHTDEDNNENSNEQIKEMITRESFASQNVYYRLTCQCENTISSAFTLSINLKS